MGLRGDKDISPTGFGALKKMKGKEDWAGGRVVGPAIIPAAQRLNRVGCGQKLKAARE